MRVVREVAALRRFVRPPSARQGHRCDLCAADAAEDYPHLFEVESRKVACACGPCGMLLEAGSRRFRAIPRRARELGAEIPDEVWEALALPVHLAFFVKSSTDERVLALYPSPAGATESLLPLGAWDELAQRLPELAAMEPDVEALLVNRVGSSRDHLIVPIDRCYALVGLVRAQRGAILGGEALTGAVQAFIARLRGGSEAGCRI